MMVRKDHLTASLMNQAGHINDPSWAKVDFS